MGKSPAAIRESREVENLLGHEPRTPTPAVGAQRRRHGRNSTRLRNDSLKYRIYQAFGKVKAQVNHKIL
jgi:hypothetical protein